jgi:predicted RNA-binding Zn-ribbon protein involved in translation (DUF1610 family)
MPESPPPSSRKETGTDAAVSAGHHRTAEDAVALPPGVLGLDLKFLCRECGTKLIIDARWQGRRMNCPQCGTAAVVPQCADFLKPSDSSRNATPVSGVAPPAWSLSHAEVEFLSAPGEVAPRVDLHS